MLEEFSGFIRIEITQEHIDACEAVLKYQKELQEKLEQPIKTKRCFGLFTSVSYPDIESECPALYTFNWDEGYYKVYTQEWFCRLYTAMHRCVGKEVCLSLENYHSLQTIMYWYKNHV